MIFKNINEGQLSAMHLLEKKPAKPLLVRDKANPSFSLKKHHALRRIINLLLTRMQLFLRSSKVLGYPTYLVVEPTNICNLKCPLCPTGQGREGRAKGKMSFAEFKKIIDELGSYLYSLRLENWGEPLLNEEIFDMIAYARLKKISTSFNTNLSILDESIAEKVVLSGLDHIKISLDGACEETYNKYRVGGDFNRVMNNVRLLVRARAKLNRRNPFIEIQFIVMRHNEHEIEQIRQLSLSLGADSLLLESVRPDMRAELFNPDAYSIEKFSDWLPEDSKYSLFDYKNKQRKKRSKICSFLWTTSVINWDGSIVPCCSIYDECYDFGNFFKEGFKKVWNGPNYKTARELIGKRMAGIGTKDIACIGCFKHGIIA